MDQREFGSAKSVCECATETARNTFELSSQIRRYNVVQESVSVKITHQITIQIYEKSLKFCCLSDFILLKNE